VVLGNPRIGCDESIRNGFLNRELRNYSRGSADHTEYRRLAGRERIRDFDDHGNSELRDKQMPPISATQKPLDPNLYTRITAPPAPMPPGNMAWQPTYNSQMRCLVPPSNFTPDSSQQFYRGSSLPQFRAFAPTPLSGAGGTSGGGSTTIIESSGSSSSETNNYYPTVQLSISSASVTTPVISMGGVFAGSVTLGHSYQVVSIASSAAARIRLYGTSTAQTLDLGATFQRESRVRYSTRNTDGSNVRI
jgi:hypothetical protein